MIILLAVAQPPEGPRVAGVAIPLGVAPWCSLRHDATQLGLADDQHLREMAIHYAGMFAEDDAPAAPAEIVRRGDEAVRRWRVECGFAYQAQRTGNFYCWHGGHGYHVLAAAPHDASLEDLYEHYVLRGHPPDEPMPGSGEQPEPMVTLIRANEDPRVLDVVPPWPHPARQIGADELKPIAFSDEANERPEPASPRLSAGLARKITRRLCRVGALTLEVHPRHDRLERAARELVELGFLERFACDDDTAMDLRRAERARMSAEALVRLYAISKGGRGRPASDPRIGEQVDHLGSRARGALGGGRPFLFEVIIRAESS